MHRRGLQQFIAASCSTGLLLLIFLSRFQVCPHRRFFNYYFYPRAL